MILSLYESADAVSSNMMRVPIWILPLSVLVCASVAFQEQQSQRPLVTQPSGVDHSNALPFSTTALEEYIEDVMERWHAAGMAVAVINGSETWSKVSSFSINGVAVRAKNY